ncbi:MAG TPA: hypothetical protein PKA76_11120 [Pirellulaceae bacterium]|nr:hypothetical protein [Pirellulaceae bacterium]
MQRRQIYGLIAQLQLDGPASKFPCCVNSAMFGLYACVQEEQEIPTIVGLACEAMEFDATSEILRPISFPRNVVAEEFVIKHW